MNPSARADGSPLPPHAARPSLFAAPGPSAAGLGDSADALRILSSLTPPPLASRVSFRPWWVGAGLTVLALLGALYGVMQSTSRAPMRVDAPAPVAQMAKPTASTSAHAVPDAEARVALPAQVARIESADQSAAPVPDPFREMSRRPVAASPAVAPSTPAAGKAIRGAVSARTPIKAGKAAEVPGTSASARRRADSDVDLLEAVVAHVSRPAAVGQGSAKPGRRDVVPRPAQSAESVGDLVQRCRAVGGLEGWLCRNRVCDGHWGSDAACPANRPTGPQE